MYSFWGRDGGDGGKSLNQSAPDLKERINQVNQGLEKVSIREKDNRFTCGGNIFPPSQGIDPVIDEFGCDSPSAEVDASRPERLRDRFHLTYGFCSVDLKRWLTKKDPLTGKKRGIAAPSLDAAKLPLREQHMANEVNRNGRYFCDRLGAACDFRILDLPSHALADWIVAQGLPFNSLYFYGRDRPIHSSYGPQHSTAS